ncbi:MAG: hypothetical protein HYX29_05330 [Solirubrobacterales bacterium]|nr:hypothetical protein [Solirubrobacterales bacterium]
MKNAAKTALLTLAVLMSLASTAFAGDAGQGWYGEVNDKIVTFFGLGLVILFPLVAAIGSFVQGRLERRSDERKSAIFKHK